MNIVVLMGRLTKDPDVRYSQGDNSLAIARYTLAVDRRRGRSSSQGDQQTADFISCVAFGKSAEFAEKYLHKGTKICIRGRIQTGSYTNKDGQKVFTTDVVADRVEFLDRGDRQESSGFGGGNYGGGNYAQPAPAPAQSSAPEGFTALTDDDIPF